MYSRLTFGLTIAMLAGCFTEVGNPEGESLISATFRIDYAANPKKQPKAGAGLTGIEIVTISRFSLVVDEAEYHGIDARERHLWDEDSAGVLVDFASTSSNAALPEKRADTVTWKDLDLVCKVPGRRNLLPDTLDLEHFHDPGFIAGAVTNGNGKMSFLFALPDISLLHMRYGRATLDSWRNGLRYDLEFVFYAQSWFYQAGLETANSETDRTGKSFVLLDARHNPQIHRSLVERFFLSFNAAEVDTLE